MLQRILPRSGPTASYTRYAFAVVLTAATAVYTTHFVASGIVASEFAQPPQAREPSRVELVTRAKDATFVLLPSHDTKFEPAPEPQVVASNLAVEIDNAESPDAPSAEAAPSSQPAAAPAIAGPMPKPHPKSQRLAAQKTARATITAELKALESVTSEPAPSATISPASQTAPTLKTAVQAESPLKSEPVRRKFARKDPNAGELVRMQLLNLI